VSPRAGGGRSIQRRAPAKAGASVSSSEPPRRRGPQSASARSAHISKAVPHLKIPEQNAAATPCRNWFTQRHKDTKRTAQSSPARGGGPPKVVEGQASLFQNPQSPLPDPGRRRGSYRRRGRLHDTRSPAHPCTPAQEVYFTQSPQRNRETQRGSAARPARCAPVRGWWWGGAVVAA
jgi:hypothetical protein